MSFPLATHEIERDDDNAHHTGAMLWAPRMSKAEFDCFRNLAKTHAGIWLPDHKRNMVYRRVSKRLGALGLNDFATYRDLLTGPDARAELPYFINALTTNKTDFFRENHHFEHLAKTALPEHRTKVAREKASKLRIWSAGCSSGQEAYSIAMTLVEALADPARFDAKILATDIDTEMIDIGRRGVYSEAELISIPAKTRHKFVDALPEETGLGRMSEAVRSLITFNPLNLHGAWPLKGKFDAIFCRNVSIYFDAADQSRLFERFADQMHDGGYLYIGHSESLFKVSERFRSMGQSIYRRLV